MYYNLTILPTEWKMKRSSVLFVENESALSALFVENESALSALFVENVFVLRAEK